MRLLLKWVLWSTVMLVFISISSILIHETFTSQIVGANDFFPRWKGATLFFQEGVNPYSMEATEEIQRGMYGRLAHPDEDQVAFAYPFFTVILLAPLVVLDLSYSMTVAIWFVLLFLAVGSGLIATHEALQWETPLWLLALFILWGLLFYNSIRTLILGQFAGIVFLLLVCTVAALQRKEDILAGILLPFSMVKPQMSLLLVVALIIWGLFQRRYHFLTAFLLTSGLLGAISFVLLPDWIYGFTEQVNNYTAYTVIASPLSILTGHYRPHFGQVIEVLLTVFLILVLLHQWYRLIGSDESGQNLLPLVMVTILISNWIIPRTATTNQIILFLPISWTLVHGLQDNLWTQKQVGIFYAVTIVAAWLLFLYTHNGSGEKPVMYLYLPLLTSVVMIYGSISKSHKAHSQELSSDAFSV